MRSWTYKFGHIAARAPVWFCCQQTNPKNFCHARMAFTINPRLSYLASVFNSSIIALSSSTASSTLTSNSVAPTVNESTGTESNSTEKDIHLQIGIIVGGICLSVIICLVAFLVYWWWKSKSRGGFERDWMITRPLDPLSVIRRKTALILTHCTTADKWRLLGRKVLSGSRAWKRGAFRTMLMLLRWT
ncbi:hypothetical protein BDQ17DRAFT_513578 [Cyathus striatus]|nr:hypothetical protein BDQ17DRAFT_513578 [Cyathus striatus]